jgi:hypothetical protein
MATSPAGAFAMGAMAALMTELATQDGVKGAVNGPLYVRSLEYRDALDRQLAAVGCRVMRAAAGPYHVQSRPLFDE